MIKFAPHRHWIAMLAATTFLSALGLPAISFMRDKAQQRAVNLKNDIVEASQSLQQMRDDVVQAKQLNGQIQKTEIDHLLEPVDRLKTMKIIEHLANSFHLAHVTYTLSPEQRSASANPPLVVSELTLSADAGIDTDVYSFVQRVQASLPGHVQLKQLMLERTADISAPLSAANIHASAVFVWLSNGESKDLVEAR